MSGKVTLEELDRHWSICDLYDALEAIEVTEEYEKKCLSKIKKKK